MSIVIKQGGCESFWLTRRWSWCRLQVQSDARQHTGKQMHHKLEFGSMHASDVRRLETNPNHTLHHSQECLSSQKMNESCLSRAKSPQPLMCSAWILELDDSIDITTCTVLRGLITFKPLARLSYSRSACGQKQKLRASKTKVY